MTHPDPRWCALIRSRPAAAPRVVDRTDFDPSYDPDKPIECECCGGTMFYTAACKIQCPNCGYQRDCSDP
ncbi:MAG TPA: hypothetical protein VFZ18_15730 [Longimicrobiaceae bacterium]